MRRASVPRRIPLPPTQVIGRPPSATAATSLSRTAARARYCHPRHSFESGSFCHTGPHRRVVCLFLAPAALYFSLSFSFSLGVSSLSLTPPFPALSSARSPFLLRSLAPSRHPHRFKRGADPDVRRSFSPPRSFSVCLARAQYSFPPLVSPAGAARRVASVYRPTWRWGPTFTSPRCSYPPLFFRLLRATNAVLMIIVARLIVATVSSPMRDDIGSEWMHAAARRFGEPLRI